MDNEFFFSHTKDSGGKLNRDDLNIFHYEYTTQEINELIGYGLETERISEADSEIIVNYIEKYEKVNISEITENEKDILFITLSEEDEFVSEISKIRNEEYKWSIDKLPMPLLAY